MGFVLAGSQWSCDFAVTSICSQIFRLLFLLFQVTEEDFCNQFLVNRSDVGKNVRMKTSVSFHNDVNHLNVFLLYCSLVIKYPLWNQNDNAEQVNLTLQFQKLFVLTNLFWWLLPTCNTSSTHSKMLSSYMVFGIFTLYGAKHHLV